MAFTDSACPTVEYTEVRVWNSARTNKAGENTRGVNGQEEERDDLGSRERNKPLYDLKSTKYASSQNGFRGAGVGSSMHTVCGIWGYTRHPPA